MALNSKRRHEGYLQIQNEHGPSFGEETARRFNLVQAPSGGTLEIATYTCHHCQRVVVLNKARLESREWCWNCDHYICSQCGLNRRLGVGCQPMKKIMEAVQTQAIRDLGKGVI